MKKLYRKILGDESLQKFDIYNVGYTYDEMKIISILPETKELFYEDMCWLAHIIYQLWNAAYNYKYRDTDDESITDCFTELVYEDGFYQIQSPEEEGYSQVYAERVAPRLIEKYLEIIK